MVTKPGVDLVTGKRPTWSALAWVGCWPLQLPKQLRPEQLLSTTAIGCQLMPLLHQTTATHQTPT